MVHFILNTGFIFNEITFVDSPDVLQTELILLKQSLYEKTSNVFSIQDLVSKYFPQYSRNLRQDDPVDFLQNIFCFK